MHNDQFLAGIKFSVTSNNAKFTYLLQHEIHLSHPVIKQTVISLVYKPQIMHTVCV